MLDIRVTNFFRDASPEQYSASCAELGKDAGKITWENAIDAGSEWQILKTPEEFDAMRKHALASGGWDNEEVNAWSSNEVQALALQWLSGDIREGFDWPESERNGVNPWQFYEELSEAGTVSSSLFKTEDGQIYWTIGE